MPPRRAVGGPVRGVGGGEVGGPNGGANGAEKGTGSSASGGRGIAVGAAGGWSGATQLELDGEAGTLGLAAHGGPAGGAWFQTERSSFTVPRYELGRKVGVKAG